MEFLADFLGPWYPPDFLHYSLPGHVSHVTRGARCLAIVRPGLPRHNGTGHWSPGRQSGAQTDRDSEKALYTISLIVSPYGDKHNSMTLVPTPRGCSTVSLKEDRKKKILGEMIYFVFEINYQSQK